MPLVMTCLFPSLLADSYAIFKVHSIRLPSQAKGSNCIGKALPRRVLVPHLNKMITRMNYNPLLNC